MTSIYRHSALVVTIFTTSLFTFSNCKNENKQSEEKTKQDSTEVMSEQQAQQLITADSQKKAEVKILKPAPSASSIGNSFNYVLKPGRSVGPITLDFDRKMLDSALGKENVVTANIDLGEGQVVKGVKLFPGTTAEAELIWHNYKREQYVAMVRISKPLSPWLFKDGIRIGTTMKDVTLMNAGDFQLYGFGWEFGGQVATFSGGKLDAAYQPRKLTAIYFTPTRWNELTKEDKLALTGQQRKPSAAPAMKKSEPVVSKIIMYFN